MSKFSVVTTRGRQCTKCSTFKTWSEFHKATANPTGYRSACKACDKEVVQARLERTKNTILHCNKCGQNKHRDLFNNLTRSRTGKQPVCRQCGIEYYQNKLREKKATQLVGVVTNDAPVVEPPAPEPVVEPLAPLPMPEPAPEPAVMPPLPEPKEGPQIHVGPVSSADRVELDVVKADVSYVYDLAVAAMRSHRHDAETMKLYLKAICNFLVCQSYHP